MRIFFGTIAVFFIVTVGALVVGAINTGANILSQSGRVLTKTFDADNMITQYEWFRQQYMDYQNFNNRISNTEAQIKEAKASNDTDEVRRLNQVLLGLQNQTDKIRTDYNAKAIMTNKSIFMNPPIVGGPVLPDSL